MEDEQHELIKESLLAHIQTIFEEMEEGMAMSHQEKYTLLEDSLENATDVAELRVAFEQWYADHADEIEFEQEADELWHHAMGSANE